MMLNSEIETLFKNFNVNGVDIPVNYMQYDGHGQPYITYMQFDADGSFAADDRIAGYVTYYDFDIYSKGNFISMMKAVIDLLESAGWTWEVSKTSEDFYETDTGYYHKTLCFAKEIERGI